MTLDPGTSRADEIATILMLRGHAAELLPISSIGGLMYVTPLPINVFLRHLLSASATSSYLGAVLMLARTAEARTQHEELIEDWTSVHDLSGASLAVLCPVAPPYGPPIEAEVGGVRSPRGREIVGAEGMRVDLPIRDEAFRGAFWDSMRRDGSDSQFGWVAGARPRSSEEHKRGWTQATSSAAAFFGLRESLIPCLLVLSIRERHGTVIAMEEDLSVYRLFKQLIVNIGPAPAQLAEMLSEQRSAQRRVSELMRVPIPSSQIDALWRDLREVERLAPELIADCRSRLAAIRDGGSSGRVLAEKLREVIVTLPPAEEMNRLNLRTAGIRSRLQRVITKLEDWNDGADNLEEISLLRARGAQQSEEMVPWRHLVDSLSLSNSVLSVGEELLAPLENRRLTSPPSLADWSFSHLMRRSGRTSPTTLRSV
ncbi:hypothetical protein AB0E78_41610 [Streptomyces sp. NPDC032198]|uniref:hypothetical protein n=1 Tax=Streptomyces sp. NPDC032198 TaxID=3155127 RepID=UPI0033CFF0DB